MGSKRGQVGAVPRRVLGQDDWLPCDAFTQGSINAAVWNRLQRNSKIWRERYARKVRGGICRFIIYS